MLKKLCEFSLKRYAVWIAAFLMVMSSCSETSPSSDSATVFVESTDSLTIYKLNPLELDLVCGERPSEADEGIVMCVAGTWTGACLDEFSHMNIASNHVSSGVFYEGYQETRNTGCFVWYNHQFQFVYGADNHDRALHDAENNGGMGFCQEMMIHEGRRVPTKRPEGNMNLFRALCQKSDSLCVIDAQYGEPFGDFINQLLAYGVTEALYLDMGPGWNYSWYRTQGKLWFIHDQQNLYSTNWIVVK